MLEETKRRRSRPSAGPRAVRAPLRRSVRTPDFVHGAIGKPGKWTLFFSTRAGNIWAQQKYILICHTSACPQPLRQTSRSTLLRQHHSKHTNVGHGACRLIPDPSSTRTTFVHIYPCIHHHQALLTRHYQLYVYTTQAIICRNEPSDTAGRVL